MSQARKMSGSRVPTYNKLNNIIDLRVRRNKSLFVIAFRDRFSCRPQPWVDVGGGLTGGRVGLLMRPWDAFPA